MAFTAYCPAFGIAVVITRLPPAFAVSFFTGDKFTFFVKLRDTPVQGLQIACAPLQLRVLEKGSILLGTGNLDLNELRELQVMQLHPLSCAWDQPPKISGSGGPVHPNSTSCADPAQKGVYPMV